MKKKKGPLFIKIIYNYSLWNIPIFGVSIATMIHEYGHLICTRILGFNGYINSTHLASVYYDTRPIGNQWLLFYISGGLLQFTVFSLISIMSEDKNQKIAARMTAIIGLIEAITEPFKYLRLTGLGALLGIFSALLYLLYSAGYSKKGEKFNLR
mgnify:CR=1